MAGTAKRTKELAEVIASYLPIAKYHGINPRIRVDYPFVEINDFKFNVETFEFEGTEDEETDDLRDYIRKWGIRIYTEQPFKSHFSFY